MGRKKTHEEYVGQVVKINPNVEVVGEYINSKTRVLHKCRIDGCEWYSFPDNILHGHGCPKCSNNKKKSHIEYVEEVRTINSNIDVVGTYINNMTPIAHMCKIHNYIWDVLPLNILKGKGCPICACVLKKTHEEYVKEVSLIDNSIEVVGQYVNAKTKILHKCKIDGHEWLTEPTNVLYGKGCPLCNKSHGEKSIDTYLINNNVKFTPQYTFVDCRNIKKLPFDFYLHDYNACIEYDGIQHFEPRDLFGGQPALEETQKHDKIKTDYCLANNIKLLRIRYDEDIVIALDDFFNSLTTQNYYERTS